ncbi:MAG: BlaI/MecI/CopY family transcriptional regulator [bacterium]|nr:BlaI/MecI/CopY family transcriptional regulator [bacterium]
MGETMPHITAAELRIMKVLWKLESGTVRQTLEALPATGDESPAYTTIMTLMKQLAEKGALEVDRERQPFVYTPAIRREQVLAQRLASFVQTVFDGQAADLVLHLAEEAELSAEDLRRIESKIQQREQQERRSRTPRSSRKRKKP